MQPRLDSSKKRTWFSGLMVCFFLVHSFSPHLKFRLAWRNYIFGLFIFPTRNIVPGGKEGSIGYHPQHNHEQPPLPLLMYLRLDDTLSGPLMNNSLRMVMTVEKHPLCYILCGSFFFAFLPFRNVTARFLMFVSENRTKIFIRGSFTWKCRIVIFTSSPAVY